MLYKKERVYQKTANRALIHSFIDIIGIWLIPIRLQSC